MDTKKVLQQLLKIADNQQKIIMKLAQTQGLPPDSLPTSKVEVGGGHEQKPADPTPPQKLEPNKVVHDPASVFFQSMSPQQKALVQAGPVAAGGDMKIKFKPGAATQANYDALLKLLQQLTSQNKIQQKFNLKPV